MLGTYNTSDYGVPADGTILTQAGWKPLTAVLPGERLAHPSGLPSTFDGLRSLGERPVLDVVLADSTRITCTADQPIRVRLGAGTNAPTHVLTALQILDALRRGRPVRLVRDSPYEYGSRHDLPLDGYLLGVLLGDGYSRNSEVTLCNEQPDLHALVRDVLPDAAVLGDMHFGKRGTGSARILGAERGCNPVARGLRALGLTGKLAPEKFIPDDYMLASLDIRVALLQGLMDTDGSIDQRYGRIEYTTASPALAEQVQDLIASVAGRTGCGRKQRVKYTSPQQATKKAARDSHRLTNIRLPEDLPPFRLPRKAALMRPRSFARYWTVRGVEVAGTTECVEVHVTATDQLWLGRGAAPFVGSLGLGIHAGTPLASVA